MAAANISIEIDTSDLLEALQEAAALAQRLGDLPPHVKLRAQQIARREGGFFEIRTERGDDGQVTIKVMAGHELLCLLADLRAQQATPSP